jgi:endonuclease/exonuclease/phosphatase (EEP) superfamily protein YafD
MLCLVAMTTLMACFGRFAWFLDVAGSFRLQYALVGLLALIVCGVRKRRKMGIVAVAVLLINAAAIVPLYIGDGRPCGEKQIRLLSANVYTANTNHTALLDLIRDEAPDVILLMEVSQQWIDALGPLREQYPQYIERPRTDNFGIAFYSRLPLERLEMLSLGEAEVPTVRARLQADAGVCTIIGTHPVPPTSHQYWTWRNGQLAEIATLSQELQATGDPVLVLGDLNAPHWSHYFRRFRDQAQLRDAGNGFGLTITWPTNSWLFSIPIDHCLVSDTISVCDRRNGVSIGSDHYPIIIDVSLPGK